MNNTIPDQTNEPSAKKIAVKYNLIRTSRCKKFALEFAKANRAHKFTRVGTDFLISCEAALKDHIMSRIKQHPSVGKTLQ